jgi:3-hydroxyacyl-CoA dehydrogenase
MGSQIACHLANVGIPVRLLDIAPQELLPEEAKAGLALADPKVRNRITSTLFNRALKLRPAPLYLPDLAAGVSLGNLDDNLDLLADADWVIEAVVERLDVKQKLHRKIEAIVSPEAIVTSNTSGIPLHLIAEGSRASDRRRFFGTHFFNPPRYLRLLELIPTNDSDPARIEDFRIFAESVLGKGTVHCKDTPGFVANRIGGFAMQDAIWLMIDDGYTVDEVDAITGPALGRPRTATFRLCDLVGVDLMAQMGANMYAALPNDPARERLKVPDFIPEMVRRGWHGKKSERGFYSKIEGPQGGEVLTLDLKTMEYRPRQKTAFASLDSTASIADAGERMRALVAAPDRAGQFAWKHLSAIVAYSADRIPEIADDIVTIDRAMRWGYNWDLGPFEICDALGPDYVAKRMEKEGRAVPKLLAGLLSAGKKAFYETHDSQPLYFDLGKRAALPVPPAGGRINLKLLRQNGKVIRSNTGASLLDLGDGVACVEFHTKMNVIGADQGNMIRESLDIVRQKFEGLVIGNQGEHFTAGANLMVLLTRIQNEEWDAVDLMVREFQDLNMSLRVFEKPVVMACHGYCLGGGVEMSMKADHVMLAAETYAGLPEVGVGLIPGGGGTKEMLIRSTESIHSNDAADYLPPLARAFETIGFAKVGTSAHEALRYGFFRPSETTIHVPGERRLDAAKAKVLELAARGYVPSQPRTDIPAVGIEVLSAIRLQLHTMHRAGYISEHDKLIGSKLGYILTGGDLSGLQRVSEQYILDLEREAFVSLCGEPKTIARIQHTLKTGKPLRN